MIVLTLARKPTAESSVVKNIRSFGCGGLNIDGTRVGFVSDSDKWKPSTSTKPIYKMYMDGSGQDYTEPGKNPTMLSPDASKPNMAGRWPGNVIFEHLAGCVFQGAAQIQGNRTDTRPDGDGGRADKSQWRFRSTEATKRGYSDADGTETVASWDCQDGCPVADLNDQSGVTESRASGYNYEASKQDNPTKIAHNIKSGIHFGDKGGASRFYKCVQGCPVLDLDEQSGERPASLTGRADPCAAHGHPSDALAKPGVTYMEGKKPGSVVYADEGSASRYYKQVKP